MLYELLYKSLSEMEGFLFINVYKSEGRLLKVHFTSCYTLHFQIFKLPHFQIVFPFIPIQTFLYLIVSAFFL